MPQDSLASITALTRFGLGPRPGERQRIAGDARGFVLAQLEDRKAALIADKLPSSRDALATYAAYQAEIRRSTNVIDSPVSEGLRDGIMARARRAVTTEAPFVERLVMFWSNFFAVAIDKSRMVRAVADSYEREAIRPHVLGRFADMLAATTRHAAMLSYLDNIRSIGPGSPLGRKMGAGLNENLARETLELHSLGVDGGYTQTDVTALAKILTGWRFALARNNPRFGKFTVDAAAHEPGTFTVLGKRYPAGPRQGDSVLLALARHPATARHVATRLARHFVADDAPAELVATIAETFSRTDGDLQAVAASLVAHEAAWGAPPAKFIPPYDFVVATHRLTGMAPTETSFLRACIALGQPVWRPPSPAGWPDADDAWIVSDAIIERYDEACRIAATTAGSIDVLALAEDALGVRLAPATREAIARASSRAEGLALLLASSEFQKR